MSDSFRRLDVDQYDEDALRPEELVAVDPKSPDAAMAAAQQKQPTVRARVASGDIAGALQVVLEDVPYGAPNDAARRTTLALLLEILNATRVADIPGALRPLDVLQRDTLMKYLYKGLQLGATESGAAHGVNCAVLLSWHEKLTQAAGTGCIVRVMSDRREL